MAKPAAPKPGTWEALSPDTLNADFNQWPSLCLSSYGPVREQASIIFGVDTSPEELHCFALDDVLSTKSLHNFHSGLQAEIEKASNALNHIRNQNLQVICQQFQASGLDHAQLGSSLPDIPLGPHSVKKASTFSSANVGFMKPGYVPGSYGNQFDILNKPEFQLGADVPKNFTQPTRLFGSDSQLMKDGPKTFGQVGSSNPQLGSSQISQPGFPTQPGFGNSSGFQSNPKPAAAFGSFSSSNIGFNNSSSGSSPAFGQSSNAGTSNIGFGKPSFPSTASSGSGFGQASFPSTASTGSGFGQPNPTVASTGTSFSFAAGLKALGKTSAEPTPQETSKPTTFTSAGFSQSSPKSPEPTPKSSNEQVASSKPPFAPISTPFSFGQSKPAGPSLDSKNDISKTPQDVKVGKQPSAPQKSSEQSNAPAFSFKSAFDSSSASNKPATSSTKTPINKDDNKPPVTDQLNITKTVTTDHGTASFIRLPKTSSETKTSTEDKTSTSQPAPSKTSTPLRGSDMLQDDLNRFKAFEKEFSDLSLDSLVNKLEDMMNVLQVSDFESHPEGTLPVPTSFLATKVSSEEYPEFKNLPPFPNPRDPKQAHSSLGPPSAYSAPNSLEPWEIEAFKNKDFINGTIPSRPPTIDLLFHK